MSTLLYWLIMKSILNLFVDASSWLATLTLFFPVIYSLLAYNKKVHFDFDMKLFTFYCYLTVSGQIISYIFSYGFGMHNVLIFRIYLPLHTLIFSYLLLKWIGLNKKQYNVLLIIYFLISIGGDFIWGDFNYAPNFMFWFDAIILLFLSFSLSYLGDKNNIKLTSEKHFIQIGIYLYTLITVFGIISENLEILSAAFFLQGLAVIVSSIYFTRSFRCLYH